MTMNTIPSSVVWGCDACGYEDKEHNKSSRPPHWTQLTVKRDAYDMTGAACADASINRFLCPACSTKAIEMINTLKPMA